MVLVTARRWGWCASGLGPGSAPTPASWLIHQPARSTDEDVEMGYIVEVRERGKSSRRLVVDDRVEVGRTAADVRVVDALVSRRHLLLTVTPAGLAVLDLGSSNGTTVNGVG